MKNKDGWNISFETLRILDKRGVYGWNDDSQATVVVTAVAIDSGGE